MSDNQLSDVQKKIINKIIEYAKNHQTFQSSNLCKSFFDNDVSAKDVFEMLEFLTKNKVLITRQEWVSIIYSLNEETAK